MHQTIQWIHIKVCLVKNLRAHRRSQSHNLWAFLVRSGLASVHCLLIHKKALSGQVRLRANPRPHGVFQRRAPQGPPAQIRVLRTRKVRLGLTRTRRVESVIPTIAGLAALCSYANFCENKSAYQLLVCSHFAHCAICSGTLRFLTLSVLQY